MRAAIRMVLNTLAERQGDILKLMLCLIMALFIGILIFAYIVAKRANPVILDEHGKPLNNSQLILPASTQPAILTDWRKC